MQYCLGPDIVSRVVTDLMTPNRSRLPRRIKAKPLLSRDTVALARSLLGKYLVRLTQEGVRAARITEVEAYDGEADRACHARNGRTARNAVMYGPGGRWYVYLCYGMHEMLNLVTGPAGYPAAILIRGVDGASGPGRLTKALGIDRNLNGAACVPESGLWIEDRGGEVPPEAIRALPRVGVDYAGPKWAAMPWRFAIDASPAGTSGEAPRQARRRRARLRP